MTYFIRRGDQQYGPYTLGDLQRYVASGHISPDDEAYSDGGAAAGRVAEVLAQPQPSPSPFAPVGSSPLGSSAAEPGAPYAATASPIPPGAFLPAYQKPTMANGAQLPPDFHWGWLLLLHFPTCGMITFVWMFLQAWWVRQIDSSSRAIWYFGAYLGVSYLIGIPIGIITNLVDPRTVAESEIFFFAMFGVAILASLGSGVLFIIGAFSMRRSMLNYFNSVENIGLRLNPVMTFFFPIWYFQYHMSRIAQWKKTGVFPM